MSRKNEQRLAEQLDQAAATIELLTESLADVEASFAREDAGWQLLGGREKQFTPEFRKARSEQAAVASVVDPLIKRATGLRCAYVWAGGVQVSVRDGAMTGQDVGSVITEFWDDEDVQATFSSLQALMAHERQLATHGELFLALPTDPRTGRVRVRSLPPAEFNDPILDPEDAARIQYWRRTWTPNRPGAQQRVELHPDLTYTPAQRPRMAPDGTPIRWNDPVVHVAVNTVGGRGVGDLWAALPWARSYGQFLSDWATLMKALSRIAFTVQTSGDRVRQAAARVAAAAETGSNVAMSATDQLQAVSTSGARFDADSGRPLAVMVAAATELPVTTLLGDPGATGARAVAETVALESKAAFQVRQDLWRMLIKQVCGHVITSAVLAPLGGLRGTIVRAGDRLTAQLPDDDASTVVVAFPERDNTAALDQVRAIVAADQTQTIPPLAIARALCEALRIPDMDEVLAIVTDDQGNFIPLDIIEQRVRDRLSDRGEAA